LSFVFYDTETTGTHTAFDQILQFAAIRTDPDLNELERFEIRCRLLPYIVPSPGAMRVTGLTVDRLTDSSLPSHYQMIRAIRAKLTEWSPAIFVGHNSLRFDEYLFRQALYKTLHNPYLTNTNGNCRSDSLRMVQAVARFMPGALVIPTDEYGNHVFKLDRLAPANGFDHNAAHDAVADVEATIHMCRLISECAPEHWSSFLRFSQKAAVNDFCLEEELFLYADFYFGKPYSWLVTRVGQNPENGAEMLVFDLAFDPDELANMDEDELVGRLSERPTPVRKLRTNASPVMLPCEDIPDHLRDLCLDMPEARRRAARIRNDGALAERLVAAFLAARKERQPSIHVEEQIYDGFFHDDYQTMMERFHSQIDWTTRPPLIGQLSDRRLRSLGNRLIYVEAPHAIPESKRREYEVAIAKRLLIADGSVPWLTLPQAIKDTDELLAASDGADRLILTDLRSYLSERAREAAILAA
jgi:exodeoxyribonuclease-1